MSELVLKSSIKSFDGWQKQFQHQSETLSCEMCFSVYEPIKVAEGKPIPIVYWLSGLTCNDQNFVTKAGAQRVASELGILLVVPDTSPRGEGVPDADDGAYDLGLGAGFYLNATQEPWSRHYHMYDYITGELPKLISESYFVTKRAGLMGHSMGGHGALTIGLKSPDAFASLSAFAPIVNPLQSPWGKKAFSHYLGDDETTWEQYDACYLLGTFTDHRQVPPILIDQGLADNFLDSELLTRPFEDLATKLSIPAQVRYREGFDHSYFFIATYIEEHLRFHAKHLGQ